MKCTLIFLPGFMTAASSYSALLAPIEDAGGIKVRVEQLYSRGIGALIGAAATSVVAEATGAADIVRSMAPDNGRPGRTRPPSLLDSRPQP